jgi:hypothetical protein
VNQASISLMMEAVSTSETSVNIYETARRSIPEDSHLQCHLLITSSIYSWIDSIEWNRRGREMSLSDLRQSNWTERESRQPSSRLTERWDSRTKCLLRTILCERLFYLSEIEWASSRHWTGLVRPITKSTIDIDCTSVKVWQTLNRLTITTWQLLLRAASSHKSLVCILK